MFLCHADVAQSNWVFIFLARALGYNAPHTDLKTSSSKIDIIEK